MPEINSIFTQLRGIARQMCTCGDRGNTMLIAPLFHDDGCSYKPIAETALNKIGEERAK